MLAALAYIFFAVAGVEVALQEPPLPASEGSAKGSFNAGRYPEAAEAYEALWTDTSTAKFLLNAAMARELAGHEAAAYLHLTRYLAIPGLQTPEIEKATARLDALKQRTVLFRIQVEPHSDSLVINLHRKSGPVDVVRPELTLNKDLLNLCKTGTLGQYELYMEPGTWSLTSNAQGYKTTTLETSFSDGEAPQATVNLTPLPSPVPVDPQVFAVTVEFSPSHAVTSGIEIIVDGASVPTKGVVPNSGVLLLSLAAGNYTLKIRAPGYEEQQIPISVTAAQARSIHLRPKQVDPVIDRRFHRLSRGMQGLGSATLLSGTVLALGSLATRSSYGDFHACDVGNCQVIDARFRLWQAVSLRESGLLIGGFGATTLIFSLISQNRPVAEKWKAQLAVGAVLVGAGVTTTIVAHGASGGITAIYKSPFPDLSRSGFRGLLTADALGFALIGTGAALVTWGTVYNLLAVKGRAKKRVSVAPTISTTNLGLNMRIDF